MSMNEEDVDNISESSPEETNEQTTSDSNESTPPAEQAAAATSEDNVPFHKHPRFQELIQERKQLQEQMQEQSRTLQELQKQMKSATPAERDELMERLEGIDPKFAGMLKTMREELKAAKQQLTEFSDWRNQSSAQTVQQQVNSVKTSFYTENKVPEERKALYEAMVKDHAARNPNLQVKDLPAAMKAVHESISKMFQGVERATTKQFVEGKKNEANKPATQTRGAPAQAKKTEQNLSKNELLAEMKRDAIAAARAGKDI